MNDLEQWIVDLENKVDSLIAELNGKKLNAVVKAKTFQELQESEQVSLGHSFGGENPNKIPMPKKEEEFNAFLGVALNGYKNTIETENAPFTKERREQRVLIGDRPLDIAGHHGAKAINDLTPFNQNRSEGFLDMELDVLKAAVDGLNAPNVFTSGGSEEIEDLMNYIHDWNLRICTKLRTTGFRKTTKAETYPELHIKAKEIIDNRSPEEKVRRTYKSATRPPIVYRKMTPAEAHLEKWGGGGVDLTKAPTGAVERDRLKEGSPVMNDPFYKTAAGKLIIEGKGTFEDANKGWDDIAPDGTEQWDRCKESPEEFLKRQIQIELFEENLPEGK